MKALTKAVIDIGSNSVRLVIFQQTKESEFSLIYSEKFKVRLGEGAYLADGYLQPLAINRAYTALKKFSTTLKQYPISQTLAVATSALRDAPNKMEFIELIQQELNITIEVIDGHQEAKYGAIAAINLLPIERGITIDIGGGSADLALIENQKVIETFTLNLGTVRLNELFGKSENFIEESQKYIDTALSSLPKAFTSHYAIGIGGTARTLSQAIMFFQGAKGKTVHNFRYPVEPYNEFFTTIINSDRDLHRELKISKNRIDTIKEGTLIWQSILKKIGAKEVISSAVGVREGLYLESLNLTRADAPLKFLSHSKLKV